MITSQEIQERLMRSDVSRRISIDTVKQYADTVTRWLNHGTQIDTQFSPPLRTRKMLVDLTTREADNALPAPFLQLREVYDSYGRRYTEASPPEIAAADDRRYCPANIYALVGDELKIRSTAAYYSGDEIEYRATYYAEVGAFDDTTQNIVQVNYPNLYIAGIAARTSQAVGNEEIKNRYFSEFAGSVRWLNQVQDRGAGRTDGGSQVARAAPIGRFTDFGWY